MANGLRIRDQNGTVRLDTSDRLGRIIGAVQIPSTPANQRNVGSIPVGDLATYGTPFFYQVQNPDLGNNSWFRVSYTNGFINYDCQAGRYVMASMQVWYGVM